MNIVGTNPISVAVCIVTCRRPAGLSRCLESLAALQFRDPDRVDLTIVVVDNDPAGSARPVVDDMAVALGQTPGYAIEPRRGIPFARNRAVAMSQDCQYVAFIDDDEVVDCDWLNELLDAQGQYDADVVAGPVLPRFESDIPQWLLQGRLFNKRRMPTGSTLHWASTANILFCRDALNQIHGPFDGRFALTGGSDRFLTVQLARSGARLVWCDEAIVEESIPASRLSVRWLIQRSYRTGNSIALCERSLAPSVRKPAARIYAKAARQILTNTLAIVPACFAGRAAIVYRLTLIATGWGMLFGLLGHRYEEYRTIHGA